MMSYELRISSYRCGSVQKLSANFMTGIFFGNLCTNFMTLTENPKLLSLISCFVPILNSYL
jgi:hypothetical protein